MYTLEVARRRMVVRKLCGCEWECITAPRSGKSTLPNGRDCGMKLDFGCRQTGRELQAALIHGQRCITG